MEQETVFVIMLKNKETGFLEKELGSLNINKNDEYIVNLFSIKRRMMGKNYILRIINR